MRLFINFVLLLFWYGIYLHLVIANKILTNLKSNAQLQPSSLVSLTLHELPPLASSCTLFPTTCWAMNMCELTLAVSHPPQEKNRWFKRSHKMRSSTWSRWRLLVDFMAPRMDFSSFYIYCVRLPLCIKYSDYYDIYLYILCYYMCCLLWRIYEMHPALCLKSGCDRSGIRGMLTVERNLDRNGQNHYLLTLLWFFSKLFLIFSHLFPLYSDYSYLFLLKTNVDFTLWNPVPKVTFRTRRPTLKKQNYFYIYLYAWVFVLMILVWFGPLIECDKLWSNVHNYICIYI
jgi:hypothetical protein